jgi:NAD(P)H-hydrate epimerase
MAIPYPPGEPLTCQQIRELDVLAIEHVGIPGLVLMENAARSTAEFIYDTLIDAQREHVVILCGPGNNGGDGFVVARHLRNAGVPVTVVIAVPREKYKGDAATNLAVYERLEAPLIDASRNEGPDQARAATESATVIVDGLLGTGSEGAPRGKVADLIRIANEVSRVRRIAIDIPSGLNGDTGEVAEPCFCANATVTFVAEKVGFANEAARRVLGRVLVVDIGVPRELIPGR